MNHTSNHDQHRGGRIEKTDKSNHDQPFNIIFSHLGKTIAQSIRQPIDVVVVSCAQSAVRAVRQSFWKTNRNVSPKKEVGWSRRFAGCLEAPLNCRMPSQRLLVARSRRPPVLQAAARTTGRRRKELKKYEKVKKEKKRKPSSSEEDEEEKKRKPSSSEDAKRAARKTDKNKKEKAGSSEEPQRTRSEDTQERQRRKKRAAVMEERQRREKESKDMQEKKAREAAYTAWNESDLALFLSDVAEQCGNMAGGDGAQFELEKVHEFAARIPELLPAVLGRLS